MAGNPGTPYDVELDPRYSHEGARPASWTETRRLLAEAELYWIATVHPAARPHLTPVAGAWHDGALWFVSLPQERKVRNLADNARCSLLTGTNRLATGVDIVVEGRALRVADPARMEKAAATFRAKYGAMWDYEVDGEVVTGSVGRAWMFSVTPETVFAFTKGCVAQTRWRFPV
ncbi:pyridoxamine 5'-phosphate oxidase family protein [Streptomyces zingiberis]|uniref:Pyridoxamine 5'-phosphate oxidase family protein n=1 Tax=Streptomyces zingiberis TaxID=2053010 RepID=A0ABX1C2Z2_9ACTN|nr:pyridoxamine 5'-phosphate oxidase family protein [Streptomyces zingiberis]NJQ03803.1 pyridoxamine 5'-phosphate oxidase family protein [Streptomyces zingiberis]